MITNFNHIKDYIEYSKEISNIEADIKTAQYKLSVLKANKEKSLTEFIARNKAEFRGKDTLSFLTENRDLYKVANSTGYTQVTINIRTEKIPEIDFISLDLVK